MKKGTRRKKPTVTQEPSVFSGVLKCPECGGNLNFHFNQGNHDIKFFSCQNRNSGLRKCPSGMKRSRGKTPRKSRRSGWN